MKPLLVLTSLATGTGGFFGGVFLAAAEYQFAVLFLCWSCLNLGISYYLIDQIFKRTNYHEQRNY